MALDDRVFGDLGIGQEAIGCFGVGPVLACQRKAAADGAGDLDEELAQALVETFVPEAAASEFPVDSGDDTRRIVNGVGCWERGPRHGVASA